MVIFIKHVWFGWALTLEFTLCHCALLKLTKEAKNGRKNMLRQSRTSRSGEACVGDIGEEESSPDG